jgi:hypothetical protein
MDQQVWSGTAGEVLDAGPNAFHATARNGALTQGATPAIAGNPGTCRYGEFDGDNDYLELPANFPNLQGSFTIAGWVRAQDLAGDQRIFADDESNSGGFAFSIGDGGAGRLRFFSRAVNPIIVDTQDAVIAADTWHFVAAVHDAVAKTRSIFVDGTFVTLSTGGTVSVYGGNWGADAGRASIGGETDGAGGEAVPQWRLRGNIDELRVYNAALGQSVLQTLMGQTRPCLMAPIGDWHLDEASWNGTAGEVKDSSANLYHGFANLATPVPGLLCNAADLASTTTGDYLKLDYRAVEGLDDFTMMAWVRGTSANVRTLMSGGRAGANDEMAFRFSNRTTFQPFLRNSSAGGTVAVPNISNNAWHHLAWTRQGTQSCLYMDGVLRGCRARSTEALDIDPNRLVVGQRQSGPATFNNGQRFDGLVDEILIFDQPLNVTHINQIRTNHLAGLNWDGTTRICGASVDHFDIDHDTAGISCLLEPLAVTAEDSSNQVVPSYTGTIVLDTQTGTGDWFLLAGNGVFSDPVAGDGLASYAFDDTDMGVAQFQLRYEQGPSPINIRVDDGMVVDDDLEGPLTFSPSGFTVTANPLPNPPPGVINDPVPAQIAGTHFLVHVTAYGQSATDPVCGVIESYTGVKPLAFWSTYDDPNAGLTAITVDGNPIAGNEAGAVNQNVAFNLGQAAVTAKYKDVGRIGINMKDSSALEPVGGIRGASNLFVVKPARFELSPIPAPRTSAAPCLCPPATHFR